jgi:hypothetical protein
VCRKLGVADSRLKSHLRLDPGMFAAAGAVTTDGGSLGLSYQF